jgi:CheY-like chemotaxis protein
VGFSVQVARNGKEAIDIFQQWHPHFIWMDMRMPVMDGYEATQKIRALPDGKEVKILALTASAFKEQHKKIITDGCDDVVHKPYKGYEIFDAMAKYLDVHYLYKEESTRPIPEVVATRPSAESLARLPAELLEALQKTARSLDMAEFNDLLDEVAILDPALRDGLVALVSDFRFDEVLKLCKLANDKD